MLEGGGAPPRLVARGIGKTFSGVRVLGGVDLELRARRGPGLMGENGAGKCTLVKILSGVHPEHEGRS